MPQATISFRDHSATLTITCESAFAAYPINLECKDQDHRDEMAIKTMIAIFNNYFNDGN